MWEAAARTNKQQSEGARDSIHTTTSHERFAYIKIRLSKMQIRPATLLL